MNSKVNMGGSRGGSDPPGKSQVAIGFLRYSGILLEGGPYDPL